MEINYTELIAYEPETGEFLWRQTKGRCRENGIAGTVNKLGYRTIKISKRTVLAHRLAWFMSYGKWPAGDVDHINGDPSDNRIANLRDVTRSVNMQNKRAAHSNSKSGLLGASWNKKSGRWMAQIQTSGKFKYLGHFPTAEAAHEAYLIAKRQLHTGCTI
jgi:HNH endonuclease/AP2 domain